MVWEINWAFISETIVLGRFKGAKERELFASKWQYKCLSALPDRQLSHKCDILGDLQKGSSERGFPDLFSFVLKRNRNKSEENGANRNKSPKQGAHIAAHRKKSEQISAPAEGQQQQLKTTSDVTSKFPWCCRASVLWSGKEALDVASDYPPGEALSCRRRAWDVP